mmetsp:Transcript_112060/g.311943  ORF Transcript_112060/g.311943 Transcript_112060/m.311943 type:complete len:330 (+) Transcript_112060:111-1100(+)
MPRLTALVLASASLNAATAAEIAPSSWSTQGAQDYSIAGTGTAGGWTWQTPDLLVGECSTVWTSSFWKYDLPYTVHFGKAGHFRWWAPYQFGGAIEVGVGKFLSPPVSLEREDGSWETHYFGANHFTPNDNNSTNCFCEYVGGAGPGQPRVLADYIVAVVPSSSHLSMEEACTPYVQRCPADNATAFEELGSPFIEVYSTCLSPRAAAAAAAVRVGSCLLLALVLLAALRCAWALGRGAGAPPTDPLVFAIKPHKVAAAGGCPASSTASPSPSEATLSRCGSLASSLLLEETPGTWPVGPRWWSRGGAKEWTAYLGAVGSTRPGSPEQA